MVWHLVFDVWTRQLLIVSRLFMTRAAKLWVEHTLDDSDHIVSARSLVSSHGWLLHHSSRKEENALVETWKGLCVNL